jgi:hypothetical protein
MKFPAIALLAFLGALFVTGCSPLTYQARSVQVQQLPAHPLPVGASYAVVVPGTSIGSAQLASIQIPGFAKAASPETADVTIEVSVGQATIDGLAIESGKVHQVISNGGGPSEYIAYSYRGTIIVSSLLRVSAKAHGLIANYDLPVRSDLNFDADPASGQRFIDPATLEYAFNKSKPTLLQQASLKEVRNVLSVANDLLIDQFTARREVISVNLATEHKTDPRFSQAASRFSEAIVGPNSDPAAFAARMKPVLDIWQQIASSPVGDDDEKRNQSKGAALYNQAVSLFLLNQLDEAERCASAAQELGVEAQTVSSLTYYIRDRRQRIKAQVATP